MSTTPRPTADRHSHAGTGVDAAPVPPAPSRRRALQQMGALALGLGAADLAFGTAIVAVRVWPATDYSREIGRAHV